MTSRLLIVVLLSLFSVALWLPDMKRPFGHPLGTPGFTVGRGGRILTVDSGSPATRAGIRPGQRIDWLATPLESRIIIVNGSFQTLHPIQRFPVRIITGHGAFTASVASEPESRADLVTVLPRGFFELVLLCAGIALVLLRPSKATWGFFVFSLSGAGAPINETVWLGPPAYQIAMTIFSFIVFPFLSGLGAVIFALYLLHEVPPERWRRAGELITYSAGIAVVALGSWTTVAAILSGTSFAPVDAVLIALEISTAVAVPMLLLVTYSTSDAAARERLRWVLFGFTVNALIECFLFFTSQEVTYVAVPYWFYAVLSGIDTVVVGSTVMYAVLKHHIIDINVAISRALVYTILSAMAVGAFALVDLFFSRALSVRSAGLMADIGLALVLGFFFNTAHARVDRFVDQLLFKNRHLAEKHLHTVIRGMPFALSEEQVDTMICDEPRRSFALQGAALLGCADNGDFIARYSAGISTGVSLVRRGDPLPTYLQGERCALRLNEHGSDAQALAVPVFSHGDLAAIAFYGLHLNGTDFDAEEIALFEELAVAAGNAYDRLEAKRLRERVRELDVLLTGALVK